MKLNLLLLSIIFGVSLNGVSQTHDTIITESGLKYFYTQHGNGPETKSEWLIIAHYIGSFPDGKVFDSSRKRNAYFTFQLDADHVIKGMIEGVSLLRVGDRVTLIIPPDLAYGEKGAGKIIPPKSTLVFDLEIIDQKEHSLDLVLSEILFAPNSNPLDSTIHDKEMLEAYKKMKKDDFGDVYEDENTLNSLGYRILNTHPEIAVEIFKLNVKAYPKSSNAYDSLGEGYVLTGDNKKAIKNYEKSLKLDPSNSNAEKMIKNLRAM
jgi:tetratricopeptide (TPR) repeat protein